MKIWKVMMRKKKVDITDYRELAHKQLDDWIEDKEDKRTLKLMPYFTKDDPSILWLGSLAVSMVNARKQYQNSIPPKPETVEVNGKKYLASEVEKLKPID